MIKAAHETLFT